MYHLSHWKSSGISLHDFEDVTCKGCRALSKDLEQSSTTNNCTNGSVKLITQQLQSGISRPATNPLRIVPHAHHPLPPSLPNPTHNGHDKLHTCTVINSIAFQALRLDQGWINYGACANIGALLVAH